MVHLFNQSSNHSWSQNTVILHILASLFMPFAIYSFMNVHVWNIGFNPVDFVIKPFMTVVAASIFLAFLTEWTLFAVNYIKRLNVKIRKRDGRISLKVVEKKLPIQMIDENLYSKEFEPKGHVIVDMRIKDKANLPFDDHLNVVKLYDHAYKMNIFELVQKANLLIKETALKNKPITFIVDSKQERQRMVSKVWLRLILNPQSKHAHNDLQMIQKLVY